MQVMASTCSSTCFSGLVEYTLFICCAFSPVPLFFTTEGKQGVKDVEMKVGRPASPAEITYWEKVTYYVEFYIEGYL